MNKDTIIDRMQSYFSGENQNPEFDTSIEMDALQLFYVRTAKRLVIANELQKKDTIYRDDFFIALRDYLLVFETSLSLSNVIISDDNPYAIKKDVANGKYYATFQFPEGVSSELAESAFMRNYSSEDVKKDCNLTTDSLIYSLTGFSAFKIYVSKTSSLRSVENT